MQQGLSRAAALTALAFIFGTAGTIIPKLLLRAPCANCTPSTFQAPVVSAILIFIGNALAIIQSKRQPDAAASAATSGVRSCSGAAVNDTSLIEHTTPIAASIQRISATRAVPVCIPALLNVSSCICQLIALIYIPASVLAGLRGVLILFTGCLSAWTGLKDKPKGGLVWACIGLSCVGAALVALAAYLQDGSATDSGTSNNIPVGVSVALLGMALAAVQVTAEQVLMERRGYDKWTVLGVEGAVGLVACTLLLGCLAIATAVNAHALGDFSVDHPDQLACCIAENPAIGAYGAAYLTSSSAFNMLLFALSEYGGVYRTTVFTARGVLTWGVEVALYYTTHSASYGTPLSRYSALMAVGYILLLIGGANQLRYQTAQEPPAPVSGETLPSKHQYLLLKGENGSGASPRAIVPSGASVNGGHSRETRMSP